MSDSENKPKDPLVLKCFDGAIAHITRDLEQGRVLFPGIVLSKVDQAIAMHFESYVSDTTDNEDWLSFRAAALAVREQMDANTIISYVKATNLAGKKKREGMCIFVEIEVGQEIRTWKGFSPFVNRGKVTRLGALEFEPPESKPLYASEKTAGATVAADQSDLH